MFFLIILIILILLLVNTLIATRMETIAIQKGYDKEARAFAMCFLFGVIGYLYVIALPDLKQRKQLDKIIELLESPSKVSETNDSAETYPQNLEQYTCDSLTVTKTEERGECFVCKQKEKITKLCRIKRGNIFSNIPICTDCINVFAEYNPNAVFDLEIKKPN